jgi:hypothetical protein
LLARFSELAVQRRFLVEDDEEMRDQEHHDGILRKVRSAKKTGLSQDDQRDAKVHWVAHAAVQAAHDEEFRGSDGGGRAQPADGELPRTAEVDAGAENDRNYAKGRRSARCPGPESLPLSNEELQRSLQDSSP